MKKVSNLIDWAVIAFLAYAILTLNGCGGDKPPPQSGFFLRSDKGISIRSASPISPDIPTKCDAQIDRLLERAAAHGLTDIRRHGALTIKLEPRSPLCYDPAFVVQAQCRAATTGCYDGTVFDKDPRPGYVTLCAAGQYLEDEDLIKVTEDGIRVMPIVRYEGEHWLLRHSAPEWYRATRYHTPDNLHPLLGD